MIILKRGGMLGTITLLFCTNHVEWKRKKERKSEVLILLKYSVKYLGFSVRDWALTIIFLTSWGFC